MSGQGHTDKDRLSEAKRALLQRRLREKAGGGGRKSIARRTGDGPVKLSFAQQRLWFLDRLDPGNPAYNIGAAIRVRGPLDTGAMAWAFDRIVERHETLRTTFEFIDDDPVQIVHPKGEAKAEILDLRVGPGETAEQAVRAHAEAYFRERFDLTKLPLVKLRVLRIGERDHVLLLCIHHIISDGWSMGVLFGELLNLHNTRSRGEPDELDPLPIQYADFAQWHNDWAKGEIIQRQLNYWRDQLDGAPELRLPTDRPHPAMPTYRGDTLHASLGEELTERVRAFARESKSTLFMVLSSAFNAVLQRYSGQDEIVIGTAIANRSRSEIEGLIGFFVNSLVMRTPISETMTFRSLIEQTRSWSMDAFSNQDLPFEQVVEHLQPERDPSKNPLFQVMLAIQNAPMPDIANSEMKYEMVPTEPKASPLDMDLRLWETRASIDGRLTFNTDLYDRSTMERFMRHFRTLLAGALAQPDAPISELSILEDDELRIVKDVFPRGDERSYDRDASVIDAFRIWVMKSPDAQAVTDGKTAMTYRELDEASNRLAHLLIREGAKPGDLIAMTVGRSASRIVTMLAIMKTGGAYAPIDSDLPASRLGFMFEDLGSPVFVCDDEHAHIANGVSGIHTICLDADISAVSDQPTTAPDVSAYGGHGAYVNYTSGSTGKPKGVLLPHRGVVRLVQGSAWNGVAPGVTMLHHASVSFDATMLEVWSTLLNGGRVAVFTEDAMTPARLRSWVERFDIKVTFITAALFHAIIDDDVSALGGLERVLTGGDAVSIQHVRRAYDVHPGLTVVNCYGPTEATCMATVDVMERDSASRTGVAAIGKAVRATRVYALSPAGAPVAIGVPGELYIAGDGVALGYVNRPELTAERFVSVEGITDAPLYRTGDVVRWRSDGVLEFLGRTDEQVKLRGFRVELGEIEAALRKHEAVRNSAVLVHEREGQGKTLTAYIVPSDGDAESDDAGGHIGGWRDLYDDTYTSGEHERDESHNFTGWNSSYTGGEIDRDEMREWQAETVQRIRSLQPKRVLELGCGTGLLLFDLAPDCERYVATDFSAAALAQVHAEAKRRGGLEHLELRERMADDFADVEPESFDLVILNSVAQYFPSAAYLERVIGGALKTLVPGGRMFIGDLRNAALLYAMRSAVEVFRADDGDSLAAVRDRAHSRAESDAELVVEPDLIAHLAERANSGARVETLWKHGHALNELTQFRFDTIIHTETTEPPAPATKQVAWDELNDLASLKAHLALGPDEMLVVTGIPNARLDGPLRVVSALSDASDSDTVHDLRTELRAPKPDAIDPGALQTLAKDAGVQTELVIERDGGDPYFTAVFWSGSRERGQAGTPAPAWGLARSAPSDGRRMEQMANNPLRARLAGKVLPSVRAHLEETLPAYMVPSSFVLLDSLPLTRNGKLDRRALPVDSAPVSVKPHIPPKTETAKALAAVWAELFDTDRISDDDDFFALGGHSLLATRLVARIQASLGVNVPLRTVFESPVLHDLAEKIATLQWASKSTVADTTGETEEFEL